MILVHKLVGCIFMLYKMFYSNYFKESTSNSYAHVSVNKCHTGVIVRYNVWSLYWSMLMLRVDSGKNLKHRNTPKLSVDVNLVIGD